MVGGHCIYQFTEKGAKWQGGEVSSFRTSPACQESTVWVRDQVHGYRYKLPYPDKYEYGYMGNDTTSLPAKLSPVIEKPGYRFVHEGRRCRISFWVLQVIAVHLWCIQNKLVLRKDTDIIHLTMGGVKKVVTLVEGGWRKIFNCPAPHQSIYEHSLSMNWKYKCKVLPPCDKTNIVKQIPWRLKGSFALVESDHLCQINRSIFTKWTLKWQGGGVS